MRRDDAPGVRSDVQGIWEDPTFKAGEFALDGSISKGCELLSPDEGADEGSRPVGDHAAFIGDGDQGPAGWDLYVIRERIDLGKVAVLILYTVAFNNCQEGDGRVG